MNATISFAQNSMLVSPDDTLDSVQCGICKWDYNKKAAVVLTFDDWTPGQFPLVVPTLKRFNTVATFFPIPDNITKSDLAWKAVQTTVKNGNEIGNHSLSHSDLTKLSDTDLQEEIREPQRLVEQNVSGNKVVSFAYPYGAGAGDQRVMDSLRASGHIGARSVWGIWDYSYDFAKSEYDYYKIQMYGMNEGTTNAQVFREIEKTIAGGGLLTFLFHSVDDDINSCNDKWYAQVKLDSLKEQLRFLKQHDAEVWTTTFGNALLYHREAHCAKLSVAKADALLWTASLLIDNEDFLNLVASASIVPLSVIIATNGEKISSISQNGQAIPIDRQTAGYVRFRAKPNAGEIVLNVEK